MTIAEFSLDARPGGGRVFVEIDTAATDEAHAIVATGRTFESAIAMMGPLTRSLGKAIAMAAPDEVSIELGVKLTPDGDIIVVKDTQPNFNLRVTWKR